MASVIMCPLAFAELIRELDPEVKIPNHRNFWVLIYGKKYVGFCHSFNHFNKTRYAMRRQMEAVRVTILNRLWPAFKASDPGNAARPTTLRFAISSMAGGQVSRVEKYWLKKAAEEGIYLASMSELITNAVKTSSDFNVAGGGSASLNILGGFMAGYEDDVEEGEEPILKNLLVPPQLPPPQPHSVLPQWRALSCHTGPRQRQPSAVASSTRSTTTNDEGDVEMEG